jgi:hypothetical protein
MKRVLAVLLLAAPVAAYAEGFSVVQTSPAAGAVVRPGQVVRIAWNVNVLDDMDISFCEQEVYISLDGGRSNKFMLSPMLGPNVREYYWTVPNISSRKAVLDLRFGCADYDEMKTLDPLNPQLQAWFQIAPPLASAETVTVNPLDKGTAAPGETMTVSWTSSVKRVDQYELRVSFDNGMHFVGVGTTSETSLQWTAPEGTYGHATFQVVARKLNGQTISSPVPVRGALQVRAEQ